MKECQVKKLLKQSDPVTHFASFLFYYIDKDLSFKDYFYWLIF